MELCLKHIYQRDMLPFVRQNMIYLLKDLLKKEGLDFVEDTITYLASTAEISDSTRFVEVIQENLSPRLGEKTMTLLEQAEQKGYKRGRQERHREGQHEVVVTTLQYLLKNKLIKQADLNNLSELTDLILNTKEIV